MRNRTMAQGPPTSRPSINPSIAPRTFPGATFAFTPCGSGVSHRVRRRMAQLIDGKAVAARVRAEVKADVERLKAGRGLTPGLAVVRVGEDPASKIYVTGKKKAAEEVGFHSWEHHPDENIS